MKQTVPILRNGTLLYHHQGVTHTIGVGTPAWEQWLLNATVFIVEHEQGTFTARKERAGNGRGGWYWRAYRSCNGLRHRMYIGKAEELTLLRLHEVAVLLAQGSRCSQDQVCPVPPEPEHKAVQHREKHSAQATIPIKQQARDHLAYRRRYPVLLTTKLSLPFIRTQVVMRPHLLESLHHIPQHSLTLISAPAGFGKTTLLSTWCMTSQSTQRTLSMRTGSTKRASEATPVQDEIVSPASVAWLSLDESDNDSTSFWHYVIAALETLQPGIGDDALALLFSTQPPPINVILTVLINAINSLPHDCVLVLDDYHLIEAQAVHDALSFFLDHMPAPLHLVIASRSDPPLPLARLRARRHLFELGAAELRFTVEETRVFLNEVTELHLAEEVIAALDARIEGWIVGLQMVALALSGHKDRAGFVETLTDSSFIHRHIIDYLLDEVLNQQSLQIQTFLLQTSILNRLHSSLCEAVMEQTSSQDMLKVLEQKHLFLVPLDDQGKWYRYHHLFADVLRSSLRRLYPERIPELYLRASVWYEQHELIHEAISYALMAAEFERAATLIEQNAQATATLWVRSEFGRLRGWLEALPETVVRHRPHLCILHASVLLRATQSDIPEVLKVITARLQDAEAGLLVRTPGPECQAMYGELAALSASLAYMQGDTTHAIAQAPRALDLLPQWHVPLRVLAAQTLFNAYRLDGNMMAASSVLGELVTMSQSSHDIYSALLALSNLALLQISQGDLHQAAATYSRALHLAEQTRQQFIPSIYIGLSMVLLEWNEVEAATRYLMQGIEQTKMGCDPGTEVFGYQMLAEVKWAKGDIDSSLAALTEIERVMQHHSIFSQGTLPAMIHFFLAAIRTRLYLSRQDLHAANRWAQTCTPLSNEPLTRFRLFELSVLARVHLVNNRFQEALPLLERLLSVAEETQNLESLLPGLLLQAQALYIQGDVVQAITILCRALSLAEPGGYIRTIINEGVTMQTLLEKLLALQTANEILTHPGNDASHLGLRIPLCNELRSTQSAEQIGSFASDRMQGRLRSSSAQAVSKQGLAVQQTGRANRVYPVSRDYVCRLLAAFEVQQTGPTGTQPQKHVRRRAYNASQPVVEALSVRELEVLHLMGDGFSNRGIAQELILAEGTIKSHAKRIYAKLHVKNRMQAVMQARMLGLL